ncbi:prolyl oligopeptidase family serine peptidase [Wenzhouxiangella marina]|uniref:Peptidase S9 n=1 Tax=Wenzhouxiangella marina TaxID=1579979 RepID=A0A0K0XYN4_9GAMM|nr:prolyl oligopeptidase family serine peptidase [Wenzhouxiangella marina]AKS42804.1 peptidase S9 [Wenzhouxiangella marina]MBB6087518.1 dipeptidyl aminopeptidase/acylaminoacyl peptidase [Wenzhouxiangella marina]
MKRLLATLLLLAGPVLALAQTPDLRQIMADPEWIGPPVEAAWWQLDGSGIVYRVERQGADVSDLRLIDLDANRDRLLDYADHAGIDGAEPVFHAASGRAVFVRNGNLFLHEPGAEGPRQLTADGQNDSQPGFSADGQRIRFLRGANWYLHDLDSGLSAPVADLRFEEDPDKASDDSLTQMQLRLFSSLSEDVERDRVERQEARRAAAEDPTRGPAPWYLGGTLSPVASSLSPDGRWLLLVTQPAGYDDGRDGQMPHYVTVDGYIEVETVRTRVGRKAPAPHRLWMLDLENREIEELDLSALPGIDQDPLAELKAEQGIEPHDADNPRPVRIAGLQWQPTGERVAIQLRAIDNKDRWLATVRPEAGELNPRHRLTDEAWINWNFNEFGWIGEHDELWLLSEESGYSHLYRVDADQGEAVALTAGDFEVMDPVWRHDGERVWMLSNRSHPTEYDLYRLDLADGELERLSQHRGIESFQVLPGHGEILVRFSESYLPPQVGLLPADGGEIERLTDTRSEAFRAIEWRMPEIVGVESSHGAGTIWAKFYPARTPTPEGGHPVVLFVHGAGYLQNTWQRYPNYFREQMFHNLLTERGYHVLDMDFRASEGYGRDWRTAIYRQMGTPELEDLIDGVNWLVANHDANPERVGLYGGSYGGFMTFMAMFRAPEVFQAGAALRPVSDWAHYNHFYTSNILNTPDVDPDAYSRSSPIEFAEGLEGRLLMTHGMLDDNVFYQDVVRLAQRLIDLEKDGWELASYPLERHGFRRPTSWRDQYQRILTLFETTIGEE